AATLSQTEERSTAGGAVALGVGGCLGCCQACCAGGSWTIHSSVARTSVAARVAAARRRGLAHGTGGRGSAVETRAPFSGRAFRSCGTPPSSTRIPPV